MDTVEAPAPTRGLDARPPTSPTHGRVAHVVTSYGLPSETFIPDALRELDAIGWESWVVAARLEQPNWYSFPETSRVLVGRQPALRRRVMNRLTRAPARVRRGERLVECVANVAPSLIHAHFGWGGVEALSAAERLGLPLLVSFYGPDPTHPADHPWPRDYRRLLDAADRVTVVSGYLEAQVRGLGFNGRVDVVPTGVRLGEFPFRAPRTSYRQPRLLFVGRQTPVKGLDVLIQALPTLLARHPALTLEVIGDGEDAVANEHLADSLGVRQCIRFRGTQPRTAVREAMERVDVVVVPSRTLPNGGADAFPGVIREAFAIGREVVATRMGGIPETVPPALRHELVPDNDPHALADGILTILDDPTSWPARAAVGRRWVEEQFNFAATARTISGLYGQLLSQPR